MADSPRSFTLGRHGRQQREKLPERPLGPVKVQPQAHGWGRAGVFFAGLLIVCVLLFAVQIWTILSKIGEICPKVDSPVQKWRNLSKSGQSCPKLAEFVQKWRGSAFSLKQEGFESNLKGAAFALSFALHDQPRPCYAGPHAWFARAMHHFPTPLLRKCLATLDPQWAKETAASADPFFLLRPLPYRGSALFWNSQQTNTECHISVEFLNGDKHLRASFNTEAGTERVY